MKVKLKKWMERVTHSTPVGMIVSFAGSTAPTGWLLCQGQAVSRTTYAKLFSVIGTTFGSGDGSTTFNLPDARGRALVGVGESSATGHTNHTLGQKGGEETHKITISEMPSHNHNGNTGGMSANSTHSHSELYVDNLNVSALTATGSGTTGAAGRTIGCTGWTGRTKTGSASVAHTHSIDSQGDNGAHNNMMPYLAANAIIYVGG